MQHTKIIHSRSGLQVEFNERTHAKKICSGSWYRIRRGKREYTHIVALGVVPLIDGSPVFTESRHRSSPQRFLDGGLRTLSRWTWSDWIFRDSRALSLSLSDSPCSSSCSDWCLSECRCEGIFFQSEVNGKKTQWPSRWKLFAFGSFRITFSP